MTISPKALGYIVAAGMFAIAMFLGTQAEQKHLDCIGTLSRVCEDGSTMDTISVILLWTSIGIAVLATFALKGKPKGA